MQPGVSDINMERVEALKTAIRNGELKMDTGKIADSLIREAQSYYRVNKRMTRLSEILDQMTTVLNDLKTVMDAEQQQLSVGQINGSQLQRITEEKARCWRRWIIWNNSAVWSRTRSVAQTMTLQSAGRRLPKNAASARPQPAQRLAAGRANRA